MEIRNQREERERKEKKFREDMAREGYEIEKVGSDGNCLFRAVAL